MFKIHFFFVPVKVFRGCHSVVAASPEASFSNFQSDFSVKDSTDEIYLLFYRVRIFQTYQSVGNITADVLALTIIMLFIDMRS